MRSAAHKEMLLGTVHFPSHLAPPASLVVPAPLAPAHVAKDHPAPGDAGYSKIIEGATSQPPGELK